MSIDRRALISVFAGAAAATPSASTRAQPSKIKLEATPIPAETMYIRDIANLSDVTSGVGQYASYSNGRDAYYGDPYYVDAWGFNFAVEESANAAPAILSSAYKIWMTREMGYRMDDFGRVSAHSEGDESYASAATINWEDGTFPWAMYTVRKGLAVQILIGAVIEGVPIRYLTDLAEKCVDRWPSDTEEREVNGLPVGGIWEMLPRLEDLPEDMLLSYRKDVTRSFQD